MGGERTGGGEESGAVYYPGLGKRKFAGAVPPGAFDFFAQSTAKYGGGAGGGRMRQADIPKEWLGDPRYRGFLSWLQEEGMVEPGEPGGPPSYDVAPLPGAPAPPPVEGPPGAAPPPGAPDTGEGPIGEPAPGPGPGESPSPDLGTGALGDFFPGGTMPGETDSSEGIIPGEPREGEESTRGEAYSELTPEEKEALEREDEGDEGEKEKEFFTT